MRTMMWIVGMAAAGLALSSCATDTSGGCATAVFDMTPQGAASYRIVRDVCFHSTTEIAGCPIWNYRIPPEDDFSDYIDIFYGGECTENNLDGSFEQFFDEDDRTVRYSLTGVPAVPPQSTPRQELLGSGTYTTDDGEQGTFEFFW